MIFNNKKKNAIVVGCGRLGTGIASLLSSKGYSVVVIDKDEKAFKKLPQSFSGLRVTGDATGTDVLNSVNIKNASILAAVTENDNVNSLIAQVACRIYGVGRVFARFSDTEKEHLIDGFPIDAVYPYLLSMKEFTRISGLDNEEDI
ncbi:MAG: TrkA family potassium uptake protein [Abditibacteriota bacterium]|nr:TrkA family potassium uptake protein [Abditibacteriota bacterium]MBP5093434.1 TrkA family potassium uptake protein [Abditibacteriota bacterium]MBP5737478.1 TrkA family potassium uptake protein [Abditibacteriota bacterium]